MRRSVYHKTCCAQLLDAETSRKRPFESLVGASRKRPLPAQPMLAAVENEMSFVDVLTAICTMEESFLVRMTEALCRLLCLANATPA